MQADVKIYLHFFIYKYKTLIIKLLYAIRLRKIQDYICMKINYTNQFLPANFQFFYSQKMPSRKKH